MPEVRVDPITGLKTIIAGERAERPGSWLVHEAHAAVDPGQDPFLPGHEDQTTAELYRDGTPWRVRAFGNLYPALEPDARTPERDAYPDLFTAQPAAGAHEVIVNAPDPVTNLAELSTEQVQREAIEAPKNYPITVFVDKNGKTAYIHSGPYKSDKQLEDDIDKYF